MLAIHNVTVKVSTSSMAANAFAKLSKCQQFTTGYTSSCTLAPLQTLLQSYQNVSNSQPAHSQGKTKLCCKRFCKVIKMLAIHNFYFSCSSYSIAANAFAKLSKCQQFTTHQFLLFPPNQLQTLLQSYQNVSNSQLLWCQVSS